MFDKNTLLVSIGMVVRLQDGKEKWFMVKQDGEDEWVFPKISVRKGESSVRTILRILGEKAGMSVRVIEEAGRTSGVVTVNNEVLPQKHLYYILILKAKSPEPVGFPEMGWFDFTVANKKIKSKKESVIFTEAKDIYRKWRKERDAKRKNMASVS